MEEPVSAAQKLQHQAAKFLSDLLSSCKVSQKTINYITSEIPHLLELYLDVLKEKVRSDCMKKNGYLEIQDVWNSLDSLRGQSLFEGVSRIPQFSSYIQDQSSGRSVTLNKVVFDFKYVWKQGAPKFVPSAFGYSISFLPQLEQLLNCKDVLFCVENPRPTLEHVFRSPLDGLFYQYHPLVLKHGKSVLAVSFYFDDVEPCDPLKSKAGKHTVRMFYWVLLNIYPEKRSTLKAINLLGVVKTKIAKKYGNDKFLEDFISSMMRLGSDGVVFNVQGKDTKFYAMLDFVSGDIPALSEIGGTKLTYSALRPCRLCMVLREEMCNHFEEDPSLLRNLHDHKLQLEEVLTSGKSDCALIVPVDDDGNEGEEVSMKYFDHVNPSINYGINSSSPLQHLPEFDVTKCLVQDIMHTLAEGVVEHVCRLLLRDSCFPPLKKGEKRKKEQLTLEQVNESLSSCDYGVWNKDRPSTIEKKQVFSNKLKQSAAQILVLAYVLPCILVKRVAADKLKLLCQVLELTTLCMGFEFQKSDLGQLTALIRDFGSRFKEIYPEVNTLKLHQLIHLVTQIRLFGPLRQHACFRFEAMHTQFTSLVPVIRSMKNISFSLAARHLLRRNGEIMKAQETGNLLYDGDIIKSPERVCLSSLEEKAAILESFPHLPVNSEVIKPKVLVKYGNTWRKGVIIYLGQSLFGSIQAVYLLGEELVFHYTLLDTRFEDSLNAYEVLQSRQQSKCVKYSDLTHPFPVVRIIFKFPEGFKLLLVLCSFNNYGAI